jgi:RNA polymerase sigma-70 factor (ECF subfamily)
VIELDIQAEGTALDDIRAKLSGSADDRAEAFTRLLDHALDRSFRLAAVILGDRDEAEDAVNDAALRAWQHLASLREPERFEAWFARILVNVCRDRLHHRHRPSILIREPSTEIDPFAASVEREALRAALAALTAEHRAVIALHYLEGLTAEQIATTLGAPVGTVKSRLHYGLAELRAAYDAAAREPQGAIR